MLSGHPVIFPTDNDQLFTLKQFLDNINNELHDQYSLPIIVKIKSLNSYGQNIKNLLSKTNSLLLLNICQLHSILAEYHSSSNRYQHILRHRLISSQGKIPSKASAKFQTMNNSSRSFASLHKLNLLHYPSVDKCLDAAADDDDDDDDDDDYDGGDGNNNTCKRQNLVKIMNEKRSSSNRLCRVPVEYQNYFELLNENDQSIEPCHKLSDLIIVEQDTNNSGKCHVKWPQAVFLRSSCAAYTKKYASEPSELTLSDRASKLDGHNDSKCEALSDSNSQKDFILLNDDIQILQPGQILTILNDCYAIRTRIFDEKIKEKQLKSPSFSCSPSITWIKTKSKIFFSRKNRLLQNTDYNSTNGIGNEFVPGKLEPFLKCQTQQGDIIYLFLHQWGLFSPLNVRTDRFQSNTESNHFDLSGVFRLKDLLSNFRFPISVRLLSGAISFNNNRFVSIVNRNDSSFLTPTKFRLLTPYKENVVFACLLNIVSTKSQEISSSPVVLPLSVKADIKIQPCVNMSEVSQTRTFQNLIDRCSQLIEQYQSEISLINVPLQLIPKINQRKQPLHNQRSQSEPDMGYWNETSKHKQLLHDDEKISYSPDCSNKSLDFGLSLLLYRSNLGELEPKSLEVAGGQANHSPDLVEVTKNKLRVPAVNCSSKDEIYDDIDKIYDCIRSGNLTDDVLKIQAKEQVCQGTHTTDSLTAITEVSLFEIY